MHITMTPEAVAQALAMQEQNPQWQGKPLRLYLDGKGCDGFFYGLSFDEDLPQDHPFPQNEAGTVRVVVDPETLEFVSGSQIVWVDDERGRGFLVENPKHKHYRGKFFKRQSWLEKLGARESKRVPDR